MNKLKEILARKDNQRILDVGTGRGNFVRLLLDLSDSYEEIIGIDISEKAIALASEAVEDDKVKFIVADGLDMPFHDHSFDCVSLSNTLHHLDNIEASISEMKRVLKPKGYLIINEMYSDVEDEQMTTHVELHHFWAQIDRINGITHNPTFKRDEIVDRLSKQPGFMIEAAWDMEAEKEEVVCPEDLKFLDSVLDKSLERVAGSQSFEAYKKTAQVLKSRLQTVGYKSASQLLTVLRQL